MRHVLAVIALATLATVYAQRPMYKDGPGGSSTVEVTCDDAFRTADAATVRELERRFRSSIVLSCEAVATKGSSRISHSDFGYRNRYASDESLHDLRMTDFWGQLGSVHGTTTRELFIGLPNRERPWVIVLHFGDDSSQIVFVSSP